MRNQFTFYKSFDDIIEDLTDKQIAEYMRSLLDVQFLRVKIDDIHFEDKILNIVWKSQKHSIQKSIEGYLNSQKGAENPFLGVYETPKEAKNTPLAIPSEGGRQQEEEKEEVKGKEEGKEKEEGKGKEEVQVCSPADTTADKAREIISHLNQLLHTHYKPNAAKTKALIQARLKEGFSVDDFKQVHIIKYAEWSGTDFEKFLRPETLYSNKFDGYLNQKISDYDKMRAVSSQTGMSALELLRAQGMAS